MPVVPKCPRCRAVLFASDSRPRICTRCGERVVPVPCKICFVCAADVTNAPRFKDPGGEYFCTACWEDRVAAAGSQPSYPCVSCGNVFAASDIYQEANHYICKPCFETRDTFPTALREAAAEAEESPTFAPGLNVPGTYAYTAVLAKKRYDQRMWVIGIAAVVGVVILVVAAIVLASRSH